MSPVARILGGHGCLQTLSCDQPTNQDHECLLRHNLRILSDPLGGLPLAWTAPERGLNGSSRQLHKAADILRNVALQSRMAGLPALP